MFILAETTAFDVMIVLIGTLQVIALALIARTANRLEKNTNSLVEKAEKAAKAKGDLEGRAALKKEQKRKTK